MALNQPSQSTLTDYHFEHEKKFLPSEKHPLPELKDGTDILQFYLSAKTARFEGNALHYGQNRQPLLQLTDSELATVQRFLAWPKTPNLRIRICQSGLSSKAFLTIKVTQIDAEDDQTPAAHPLIKNLEFERPIAPALAEKLLYQIGGQTRGVISKTRYEIHHAVRDQAGRPFFHYRKPYEIDVFHGPTKFTPRNDKISDNTGLTLIELEIAPDESFNPAHLPPWIGPDVTPDRRYTNASLSKRPFAEWK